jgi:ketosteroid isomerase-like protein
VVAFVFRGGVETLDGATHDYDGALTYVYERRGEHWRIVHIHESAFLPESP